MIQAKGTRISSNIACQQYNPVAILAMAAVWLCWGLAGSPLSADPGPRTRRIPEGTEVLHNLEYARVGELPLLLDLYRPAHNTEKTPLIIWIHGGGWRNGSKEQCYPPLSMLSRGYAIASINYRLTQQAIFPAQLEDCKSAVRWLRAHAAEYKVDPEAFGAWGSSAGGHLVALLGTTGETTEFDHGAHLDVSSRVQAVCDFYGPSDLLALAKTPGFRRLTQPNSPEFCLLGGPVLELEEAARRASPVTYAGEGASSFLILHGEKDPVIPASQSQLLTQALQQAGAEVTLHLIPDAGHGGPEFHTPERQEIVAAFFAKHLKPPTTYNRLEHCRRMSSAYAVSLEPIDIATENLHDEAVAAMEFAPASVC